MARTALAALTVVALAGCGTDEDAPPELDDPRWNAFLDAREGHLRALAVPILDCVARQDTTEPAFHGCYDWHSAVHGTFSLLAISRLTGDPQYAAAAEAVLEPTAVAAELERLRTTGISYEIPYGYAWFLALARERARGGVDDLMPLAAEVVTDLEDYVFSLDAGSIQGTALAPDYDNLSWVVENLHAHAAFTGDTARAAAMTAFARDKLLPLDAACPLTRDATTTMQFFPPCLHRVLALAHALPSNEVAPWIAAFVPAEVPLVPLTTTTTPHSSGVDFSRGWGLYALWRATAKLEHLHSYLDHVETWMALPQYWAQDYDNYAHWVAQFGVYAIASSFDEDVERL
jgi:hypothetical protein